MLKKQMNNKIYLLYLLLSIIFLSIFSYSSSPLYDSYGGDSSIFMLIGKGILHGRVPYVDLFDHKGPILFFIEAFAQSIIPGRWGIFIFQILNLFCCLIMIHKISMLFISSKKSVISNLAALGLLGLTLRNGNISEEYSLILLLVPIYLSFHKVRHDR